ncbi:MAG: nitroreductase family protein [bacterium]
MKEIYHRRSVRKYKDEIIPLEIVKEFIKAGMNAPSANNVMPWQFIIINDKTILSQITKFHPYANMLNYSSGAILVCGDRSIQNDDGYLVLDCSAATENILLEIDSQGFGAVWLGIYPNMDRMSAISDLIKLPETVLPITLISYGVPMDELKSNNKYFEDRIRVNRW